MLVNTLLAIGAAHALYLAMLVLARPDKGRADYLLMAYLAVWAAALANAFLAFAYRQPDLLAFQLNINLLLAPLFFLYIRSLIAPGAGPLWPHFLPYSLTWAYWLGLFVATPAARLDALFAPASDVAHPWHFALAFVAEALAIPVYVVWSRLILARHRRRIPEVYSYTEGIDLQWANALVYCTGALWLGVFAVEVAKGELALMTSDRNIQLGYAIAVVFVFYLGYFGLRQGHIGRQAVEPAQSPGPPAPEAKYQKSGLKADEAQGHLQALATYVEREKPYLQNRLSIDDLARGVGIPEHHLSQVINGELGQSFYDYVNRHRVEEFKRRVADPQYGHFNVLALALDCGFNSKSSFNRIFKQLEGCTPTQYARNAASGTSHPSG